MNLETTPVSVVALSVIRGELPLGALSGIGIEISCRENSCKLDSKVIGVLVTPLITDLAQGFLTYQDSGKKLRLWAFFILGESAVDLSEVEAHPQGNALIEALWDASSSGEISSHTIKITKGLVNLPTPRWKL